MLNLKTDDTEIEFTRWLESFHKSLQTAAVKRRRELSPFISFKNSANNLQHIGEVHEVFEALKIAIEPSESMYYFYIILMLLSSIKIRYIYALYIHVLVIQRPCYFRMDLMGGINSTMTSLLLAEQIS